MKKRTWETIRGDKEAARRKSAARPFAEKLAALDRLRDRAHALKGKKPTRNPA